MSSLTDWVNETPERRREYERETLLCSVAEAIHAALDAEGKTQAVLAVLLDCSESNVTQILNGQRNMTLRTLADIAHALGRRVKVTLESPTPETSVESAADECMTKVQQHFDALPNPECICEGPKKIGPDFHRPDCPVLRT